MRLKRLAEFTPLDGLQVGLALMLAYWAHRYAAGLDVLAVASAWTFAAAFILTALVRLTSRPERLDVATLALGIGALAAPFVLGFADIAGAKAPHLKIGIVAVIFAGLHMATRFSDGGRTENA